MLGKLPAQHRAVDFRDFLDDIDHHVEQDLRVCLICDNLSTHKAPAVRGRLVEHPRFELHFTPTDNARPFKWTRSPDQIIDAIGRYCDRISGPGHQEAAMTSRRQLLKSALLGGGAGLVAATTLGSLGPEAAFGAAAPAVEPGTPDPNFAEGRIRSINDNTPLSADPMAEAAAGPGQPGCPLTPGCLPGTA